jgi:hypothetical protein
MTTGPWLTADSESRPPAASGELRPVRPGGGIGTETVTPNPAATGTRVGVFARVPVRARAWKSQTPRLTAGRPTDFEKKVGRLSHPDLRPLGRRRGLMLVLAASLRVAGATSLLCASSLTYT